MTLPASPPITAQQINVELGRASTAAFSITGADERALAGVPSGAISFSDFLGKSAASPISASYIGKTPNPSLGSLTAIVEDASIGTAATDRLVVLNIHWSEGSTHRSVSEVRFNATGGIGGILANIAVQSGHSGGGTGFGAAIVYAVVPTGTTADIYIEFSGTGFSAVNVHTFRYTGLSSTTPNDTTFVQSSGTATDINTTIDVDAGGLVQVAVGRSSNANTGTITGATERYDTFGNGAMSNNLAADTARNIGWDTSTAANAGNCLIAASWD